MEQLQLFVCGTINKKTMGEDFPLMLRGGCECRINWQVGYWNNWGVKGKMSYFSQDSWVKSPQTRSSSSSSKKGRLEVPGSVPGPQKMSLLVAEVAKRDYNSLCVLIPQIFKQWITRLFSETSEFWHEFMWHMLTFLQFLLKKLLSA